MKNYLLLFGLLVFTLSACEKDDPRLTADTLHYDGDNLAAPQLPEGTYEAAAKFTFSKLQRFQGKKLYEVNLYIESVPTNVELRIYGEGDENIPGAILYESDWNGLNRNSWNDHTLTTPIDITGEELWISVIFTHPSDLRSIGCDPGPAEENGDWLLSYDDPGWQRLYDFTNEEVDINWNIRGQTRD
jgi:hypothetical protein